MPVSEDDRSLLALHRPELRFHPLEPYRADSPRLLTDTFLESAYANQLRNRETGKLVAQSRPVGRGAALSLDLLTEASAPYYPGGPSVTEHDFLAAHDDTMEADAQRVRMRPGWHDMVFCRRAPGKDGRTWLQYWFFYYDNPFHVGWIGRHQGDWEMIQIAMEGRVPVAVTYAQHDGAERRDWSQVIKADAGAIPVVYVAKYSHASYFTAGTHPRLLGVANDHTADGERLRPEPYFLDDDADRWLGWPGRWGATWQPIDKSPQGPRFQDPWLDPDEFHFTTAGEGGTLAEAALEAALVPAMPAAPEAISAVVDGSELAVTYAFPLAPRAGDTTPVRIELALQGETGPPLTRAYDVTALEGAIRHPLPAAAPPYRLSVGVYDEQDVERLLEPIDVAAPVPRGGLESGFVAAPAPRRRRPAPMIAPLRVLAKAPAGVADPAAAAAELAARVAADLGPWTAAPLFAPSNPAAEPELTRWVALTSGAAAVPGTDLPGTAFEAARRLSVDDWTAEPDLPSTVFVVDPPGDDGEAFEADKPIDFEWALRAINARDAWNVTPPDGGKKQGEGVVIGQADTGFTDHPELELGALDRLRDFDVLSGDDDAHAVLEGIPPLQFPSHGTSTASVAVSREAGQITGAAPLATLVPIRAATTVVHIHNGNLAAAVDYARELDVGVITISMGGVAYPAALRTAIQRAVAAGIIVMAAAGQPLPIVVAPACFPECLAVGGTREDDAPWLFSARGPEVDWSAPAKKVPVAATANSGPAPFHVAAHTGTSFSVALSAGVAALWLAHHGGAQSVRDRFGDENVQWVFKSLVQKSACVPTGWDTDAYGAGIIDAAALLALSLDAAEPSPPADAPRPGPLEWAARHLAALLDRTPEAAHQRLTALADGDAERIAPFAGEIVYRAAEDAELRAALAGPAPSPLEGDTLVDAGEARTRLSAMASPGLQAVLS